ADGASPKKPASTPAASPAPDRINTEAITCQPEYQFQSGSSCMSHGVAGYAKLHLRYRGHESWNGKTRESARILRTAEEAAAAGLDLAAEWGSVDSSCC